MDGSGTREVGIAVAAFACCLAAFAPEAIAGAPISDMDEAAIDGYLKKLHEDKTKDTPARLAEASALFVGTPFGVSPLGEGEGNEPDEDPLYSFETVDCQTFVEEALALAVSPSFEVFKKALNDIRYSNGEPSFETRNHFPEAQWVTNNAKKGYVWDITFEIGGKEARVHRRALDPGRQSRKVDGFELPVNAFPSGDVGIVYIPYAKMSAFADQIPHGAIVHIVRVENPRKAYMTTHQGIVVVKKEGKKERRYIRHASRHFGGKVTDMTLSSFLSTLEKYEKWPALGIRVFVPRRPG
ncbi:MAG: DUF1460 domain-containing protein [Deltaproteobacteria bacterium]|nr:DUF1460 domain-containing protein [Deltaproteobacteria bacterium]